MGIGAPYAPRRPIGQGVNAPTRARPGQPVPRVVRPRNGPQISYVQTFLPYPSFRRSAQALDDRRLGKQRVEVLQILNALCGVTPGWRNHPAVRMWRGYERALVLYGRVVTREWCRRGFADTVEDKLVRLAPPGHGRLPPWVGREALHRSHQSALVRKNPAYYGRLFPDVPPDLPYYWPEGADRKSVV